MTFQRVTAVALISLLAGASRVAAQEVRGFAHAGFATEVDDRTYPAVGGGLTVTLGQPWVSAGAEGDYYMAWPYLNGRAAVFGQANMAPARTVRPFAVAGYSISEYSGPMFGGGVELRPSNRRIGFRFTVEDYLVSPSRHSGTATNHHVSFRAAVVF